MSDTDDYNFTDYESDNDSDNNVIGGSAMLNQELIDKIDDIADDRNNSDDELLYKKIHEIESNESSEDEVSPLVRIKKSEISINEENPKTNGRNDKLNEEDSDSSSDEENLNSSEDYTEKGEDSDSDSNNSSDEESAIIVNKNNLDVSINIIDDVKKLLEKCDI